MSEYDQLEAFRAHLEEKGRVLRIARDAVINRAREVAAIAPKGQKADRDDYTTMVACGPLYRLADAVRELDRQQEVVRAKQFEAPGQGQEPTGSKAGASRPAPEVGAPTGAEVERAARWLRDYYLIVRYGTSEATDEPISPVYYRDAERLLAALTGAGEPTP